MSCAHQFVGFKIDVYIATYGTVLEQVNLRGLQDGVRIFLRGGSIDVLYFCLLGQLYDEW